MGLSNGEVAFAYIEEKEWGLHLRRIERPVGLVE
jgi:hypothetical protein